MSASDVANHTTVLVGERGVQELSLRPAVVGLENALLRCPRKPRSPDLALGHPLVERTRLEA
eukprot:3308440-Rhodomonas_salina.2